MRLHPGARDRISGGAARLMDLDHSRAGIAGAHEGAEDGKDQKSHGYSTLSTAGGPWLADLLLANMR